MGIGPLPKNPGLGHAALDADDVAAALGYVMRRKFTFRTANGDEPFRTGDAYYVGPGHTLSSPRGTEVIEFSPTEELRQTLAVVEKNMEVGG